MKLCKYSISELSFQYLISIALFVDLFGKIISASNWHNNYDHWGDQGELSLKKHKILERIAQKQMKKQN